MNAPFPAEHRAAARTQRPFDALRQTGALAPHDGELNMRRWQTGDRLLRMHNRGWHGDDFQSQVATDARTMLGVLEREVGLAGWPIVVRVVIVGDPVDGCRGFFPEYRSAQDADIIALDRLRVALDRIAPALGVIA